MTAISIDWQNDRDAEQGIPGQFIDTATWGDHSLMLIRNSSTGRLWIAQVDGRMVSDGAVEREEAEQAVWRRIAEITRAERGLR